MKQQKGQRGRNNAMGSLTDTTKCISTENKRTQHKILKANHRVKRRGEGMKRRRDAGELFVTVVKVRFLTFPREKR